MSGKIGLGEVMPFIKMPRFPKREIQFKRRGYNGFSMRMNRIYLRMLVLKGTDCVACGIKGEYFLMERVIDHHRPRRWHLHLYGTDANGNEVMITKDHIIPKSKGGEHNMKNLQPMCEKCNTDKGDEMPKSL